ncbi:MAG: hypothetical protein LBV69_08270 [Bacteroidales bacterium]|jgi:hypothetical protein|nr:hypothetical protein [Bacteroidales bacterium]
MKNKNIENITIEELKELSFDIEFTKFWHINKDSTKICQDCEYRYMCIDDRMPIKVQNGEFFYKTKCPYNPYICKWQGEEGYVPIEECGTSGKETGFVPDEAKIKKLNQQIWSE